MDVHMFQGLGTYESEDAANSQTRQQFLILERADVEN